VCRAIIDVVVASVDLPVPVVDDRDDDPAVEAWHRIRAISHNPAAMAAFHRLVGDTGLPLAPLRALLVLPLDESIPMRQLAQRLGCDNSYVTALVDALEQRGLATRRQHPTDRRVKVIELTPDGRKLTQRVQLADTTPPVSFSNLNAAEVSTLRDLLRKIGLA
jgi:DNA-binding MarR family transcriptional regulator